LRFLSRAPGRLSSRGEVFLDFSSTRRADEAKNKEATERKEAYKSLGSKAMNPCHLEIPWV
jgi:hypothetical protein